MKKKVMTKKKIALTASLAGLAVVPAVVTPLVLSTKNKQQVYVENYDEEYGVDQFVYETIEKKFRSSINAKIDADNKIPLQFKQIEKERNEKVISVFRSKLDELVTNPQTKPAAHTTITNAMIDYANSEYGIKLNRETKATFADIDRLYMGIYKSWQENMKNAGMSETATNAILGDAEKNFSETKLQLTRRYSDALSALIQAKRRMVVIFGAVNKEIGLAAAAQRLQDFLEAFNFQFKENSTQNRLNQLEASTRTDASGKVIKFEAGSDITLWMNDIFTVVDTHTGEPVSEGFTNSLIPGYKITPVLHEIKHDLIKNEHSIEIDWQCVKSTFTGQDAIDATAHLFIPDKGSFFEKIQLSKSANEIFDKDHVMTVSYAIPKTAEGVMHDLTTTFPNRNDTNAGVGIKFKWDEDKSKCAYEAFLRGTLDHETATQKFYNLSSIELADSGLMFSTDNGEHFIRLDSLIRSGLNTRKMDSSEYRDNLPSFCRKFVDGCSIWGEAILEKGNHNVKVTLHYSYTNAPDQAITIDDIPSSQTSDFPISEDAFKDIVNEYNKVRMFHKTYKDNVFEQDLDAMHTEKVLQDVVMALTAIFDTLFIAASAMPTKDPLQKKINIAYIVTSAIDLGLEIASYTTFRVCKYDITKDYADNAKSFKGSDEYAALDTMLAKDKEEYQLLDSEDDGALDENEFHWRYVNFWRWLPEDKILELQSHYDSEKTSGVLHNYRVATQHYDVDADEYHNKLRGWDKGQKWDMLVTGLNHASLSILAVQMVLGFFDPAIKTAIEARRPAQEGAQAAERVSRNLYQRVVDFFVSIYRGIKNFFQTIKLKFQEKIDLIKLIETNPEEAAKYISQVLRDIFDIDKIVGKNSLADEIPLFSIRLKDGTYVAGKFEKAEDFFKYIGSQFKAVSKTELYTASTLAEKMKEAEQSIFRKIYDKLSEIWIFVKRDEPLTSDAFDSFDDLFKALCDKIDNYLGNFGPFMSEHDIRWDIAMRFCGITTHKEKDMFIFDETAKSLFSAIKNALHEMAVTSLADESNIWSIYFVTKEV